MSFPCAMRFVLASYLIGIERSEQVATYPLRGVLFENLVIAEALKYRFNHGRRFNLSFFRDSRGLEYDLLFETGCGMSAIEIKSREDRSPRRLFRFAKSCCEVGSKRFSQKPLSMAAHLVNPRSAQERSCRLLIYAVCSRALKPAKRVKSKAGPAENYRYIDNGATTVCQLLSTPLGCWRTIDKSIFR